MDYLGWFFLGLVIGGGVVFAVSVRAFGARGGEAEQQGVPVAPLIRKHFDPVSLSNISVAERRFPFRMRADLQRTLDRIFEDEFKIHQFLGVRKEYTSGGLSISDCIVESEANRAVSVPPEYEELDIGDEHPLRVLKEGLWLLESHSLRFAVMVSPCGTYGEVTGMQVQVGSPNTAEGSQLTRAFFKRLEEAISKAESYRGKILSLEQTQHAFSGESAGISVHKLRHVERDQVILPQSTLNLLERNVVTFVKSRSRLSKLGMATKKGILLYGPPGTGKTHTIHFLANALADHTTLLISAEQVALLSDYMSLARLLQPSIVVMEDVDLIARERTKMDSPCEEVLLNKLLNEMDGLKEEADILFILTTNRPAALEAALASRPGRIDQAIEFPLPDEDGRRKLVQLYSGNLPLSDDLITEIVRRTDGVSAAFIKELMRRTAQFAIEQSDEGEVTHADVDSALDEMLFKGGSLNLKILGAAERQEVEP